jgi:hypothetical protein
MKKNRIVVPLIGIVTALILMLTGVSGANYDVLKQTYKLAGERSQETQFYRAEHRFVHFREDGARERVETFRCYVKAERSGSSAEKYVCRGFSVQTEDQPEKRIPALVNWSYTFERTPSGLDKEGRVFGIDHGVFSALTDDEGVKLADDVSYRVYNSFIDFHAFCNTFAQGTHSGKGIQDLRHIGQKIVHESAFSNPSVNLEGAIGEGSHFQNGEVSLLFKGLSAFGDCPCAIVTFDSGDASFTMKLSPAPNINVLVEGGSHYKGDLFLDLGSKWVRKVTMSELVVTKVSMGGQKVANGVIERSSTIESISELDYLDF